MLTTATETAHGGSVVSNARSTAATEQQCRQCRSDRQNASFARENTAVGIARGHDGAKKNIVWTFWYLRKLWTECTGRHFSQVEGQTFGTQRLNVRSLRLLRLSRLAADKKMTPLFGGPVNALRTALLALHSSLHLYFTIQ